jgi:hypothetical protein
MAEKTLEELSKIPISLIDKSDAVRLLQYVAKKIGCDVSYSFEGIGSAHNTYGQKDASELVTKIRGTFITSEIEHTEFQFERGFESDDEGKESKFELIVLSPSSLSYSHVDEGEKNRWREINKYVQEFFSILKQESAFT